MIEVASYFTLLTWGMSNGSERIISMTVADSCGIGLADKIVAARKTMTGAQKTIADYILKLPTRVAFMTADEVAVDIGVSSASVVRFAQTLGYDGFASLKRSLQDEIQFMVDPADRVEKSLAEIKAAPDALRTVVETDLVYLQHLLSTISRAQFNRATEAIVSAKRIGVCGTGSTSSLVDYFTFRMRRFRADVIPITTGGRSLFEQLHWLEQGDVIIVFAFLNPSEEIFTVLNYAEKMGIESIVITDIDSSIAASLADVVLVGQRGPVGYFHSHLVPSAIVNALILAYAKEKGSECLISLRRFLDIRAEPTKDE